MMRFTYSQSLEQRSGQPQRRPVVIVGAGPVGLAAALDLGRRDVPVVLIDDNDTVSVGSRAVCWSQKCLQVLDRLGVGEGIAAQGVRWQRGRVFHGEHETYAFDLLPEPGHKMPAMVNLQQYLVEEKLVRAAQLDERIELRWKHELIGLTQEPGFVRLEVRTPDGIFEMQADWVLACDGARSPTRTLLGIPFVGQVFEDRFLIADVKLSPDARPRGLDPAQPERWFWFDPPFHPGQSVLLHAQAEGLWRIDFQLGRESDAEAEKDPDRVKSRVTAMLGEGIDFELEWVSVYQFACRRAARFRQGRVLLAGDSAHQVSPFGARGANSGVQDVDNLAWKLAAVLRGDAPEALLASYETERIEAADDNIGHSTRATDFISPKSRLSRRLQRAVLDLAATQPLARPLVNSGRLSTPTPYTHSPLSTPDAAPWDAGVVPGAPLPDAPVTDSAGRPGWLLEHLCGDFALLVFGDTEMGTPPCRVLRVGHELHDPDGLLERRLGAAPGCAYLIRPDGFVAARWHWPSPEGVQRAWARVNGRQL
jgi:3-(3-hydroxy-phenyl)propionate hydroxylase